MRAERKLKLLKLLQRIDPIILSPVMIMRFLTRLAKAGNKNWMGSVYLCRVNCSERQFQTLSSWVPNREKFLAYRQRDDTVRDWYE